MRGKVDDDVSPRRARYLLLDFGGVTFLQPGDSVLLEDHLFLKHVDVLFFSPTEHNMHVDPSVILINELEPEFILPQHRDTYRVTPQNRYWTSGYPSEVKLRLSKPLGRGESPPIVIRRQ